MTIRLVIVAAGLAGLLASAATAAPVDEPGNSGLTGRGSIDVQAVARGQTGNPLWGIPLRTLAATRDRPIFSPSRRPPPAAVAAPAVQVPRPPPPPPPVKERPQLSLIGTVLGGEDGIGIFLDMASKRVVRLRTGENIDGWVLTAVRGREATLQKSNETMLIAFPAPDQQRPANRPFPGGLMPR